MSTFKDIIGYSVEKKELEQIADVLKNKAVYEKLGVSLPRGLVLYGEPGVGKTTMANALIEASGRRVYICRKNQPNGDFVREINEIFNKAVKGAPSIVFLDDLDKFANEDEEHRDAEEYVTVQSCIDEIKGEDVFVLATANSIRNMPDSLIRAGRFDRVIEIDPPRGTDAEKIIEHYCANKKLGEEINIKTIARILNGRSCAELETIINEAGLYAGYNRENEISMEHVIKACVRTIYNRPDFTFGNRKNIIDMDNKNSVYTQVVYHEAGHTVISEILCPQSVTFVMAMAHRENGFTQYYNDNSLNSLRWRQSRIISSLGGIAAEDQKLGIICSGNEDDLDKAFAAVGDLVVDNCVCGFQFHSVGYRSYSNELKARREHVVSAEIERYYHIAKEIIAENTEFLDKIARKLAEKGLLTMDEIQKIKSSCKITYFDNWR